MAKTKKRNRKLGRSGRIALSAFVGLLLLFCIALGGAALNAGIIRVRRAEVVLRDLPDAFDGKTILYASDIDLCGLNDANKSGTLFKQLQSLSPDMLILGGDYTSSSLLDILNNPEEKNLTSEKQLLKRMDFFHYIMSFQAPLGKYAIASPEDADQAQLAQCMSENGIQPLFNLYKAISIGSDTLYLTGVCTESSSLNSAGSYFSRNDCVIVTAFSPAVLPVLLTSEASDGGQWADIFLCGHTHGGQIRLLGRDILQLSRVEKQYRSGWYNENNLPILTTEGLGCEGANLRIGSAPEVWLITLKKI